MEKLKLYIEKLKELYFKLNGMFDGVVENLDNSGVDSEDVKFLKTNLNPNYISSYLEEIDEAVIEYINHSLDCDAYLYTVEKRKFAELEQKDIYDVSSKFNLVFLKDLKEIEDNLSGQEFKINGLGLVCEEMRSSIELVNETLYVLSRNNADCIYDYSPVDSDEEYDL